MSRPRCSRCRKAIFVSREAAEAARLTMPEPAPLKAYRCPYKDGVWHIGHVNGRVGPLLALERAVRREEPPTG
jgi:hypothetical protein